MSTPRSASLPLLVALLAAACGPAAAPTASDDGFCAIVVHEGLGPARHVEVAANGDVLVALRDRRESRDGPVLPGGVALLRDTDGDALPDTVARFGERGGNDVLLADGWLWTTAPDRVDEFEDLACSFNSRSE